jgi:hypothetical protein
MTVGQLLQSSVERLVVTPVLADKIYEEGIVRAVYLVLAVFPLCWGQDATRVSMPEHTPAEIRTSLLVIASQVISNQRPQTPQLVTAPVNLQALEPGQCVQFGITATGDGGDRLLQSAKFYLEVQFAGKIEIFQGAGAQMVKDLKPVLSLVSVAIPPARWCVPLNASSASATIKSKVTMTSGKSIFLPTRSIPVNPSETARHPVPVKTPPDLQSISDRGK